MMVKQYILCSIFAGACVLCALSGCAQKQANPNQVTIKSDQLPQKTDESKLSPEQKQFQEKIASPAETFSKKSSEFYASGKKPPKPWWTILWPWGQEKKTDQSKMNLKEFQFKATYPNAK
jgi:hypothetical protein